MLLVQINHVTAGYDSKKDVLIDVSLQIAERDFLCIVGPNGGGKTITAILPIIDDMERAIENAHKQECVDAVEEGWELIYKKLLSTLEGMGVKKMEVDGKDFDVDFHEAVAMVPGMGDEKKGKIIDCLQTGYTLNDKVIRHAKVAVGQ